ncbi:MAG: LytTR family DNA-binding domain-containing protein [Bacteroidota bacterium]|nr:LytTR family DNA-binding domain-containing protein [Bacteroidota bacterium]
MITSLIIDDDAVAGQFLANMLKSNFAGHVKVVGVCTTVKDAKSKINDLQPDVVFLDIQMPEKSGFELIDDIKRVNFEVIITTVSKDYAVDAFKINAIDYLVKPINLDQLTNAIAKVKAKQDLMDGTTPKIGANKIGLPTNRGVLFFEPSQILYCEADNNYTDIVFANGEKENICRTLKEVEAVLSKNFNFFRIHKSYLINFEKISQYIKADGGYLLMENSKEMLPVSKNSKENLLKYLKML